MDASNQVNGESKKLINDVETCVDEMLAGIVAAFPGLDLHPRYRVILRKQPENKNENQKVVLVSGGGSGHEPFCAGYIGRGMLSAICAGSVFASPPATNILHAIKCVFKQGAKGVLAIIPNYTGDCLNFGVAVQRARSHGFQVEAIAVGEDCAQLLSDKSHQTGRRGMCGLLFVYKIIGEMAEHGLCLEDLVKETTELTKNMATLGVSLSACSLPGQGPLFTLKHDEIELGLGVHGEQGITRMKLCRAKEIISLMVDKLTTSVSIVTGDSVAVLINNLGSTSQLEQALLCGQVKDELERRNIEVIRIYAGHLMTSLDMAGMQISLLKLPTQKADAWIKALDAPTDAFAWPGCGLSLSTDLPNIPQEKVEEEEKELKRNLGPELKCDEAQCVSQCLMAIAKALEEAEDRLNELDSGCGDGDCGSTLRRFADRIISGMDEGSLSTKRPADLLHKLSSIAESCMGGTSGAVYSLFLATASAELARQDSCTDSDAWLQAWQAGLNSITTYSGAHCGDRTMLDALDPACKSFEAHKPRRNLKETALALKVASEAADAGCQATRNMTAKVGRASYVDPELLKDVDAGAFAVTVCLRALSTTFSSFVESTCPC